MIHALGSCMIANGVLMCMGASRRTMLSVDASGGPGYIPYSNPTPNTNTHTHTHFRKVVKVMAILGGPLHAMNI